MKVEIDISTSPHDSPHVSNKMAPRLETCSAAHPHNWAVLRRAVCPHKTGWRQQGNTFTGPMGLTY